MRATWSGNSICPTTPALTSTTLCGPQAKPIRSCGSFVMNVMRMEKGFKGAGELANEVTLAEADVLRFARTDKDYLGRDKSLNTDLRWVCVIYATNTVCC